MTWYAGHDLILEVQADGQAPVGELAPLLDDLSFRRIEAEGGRPALGLAIRRHQGHPSLSTTAREVFRADGWCGREQGDTFYLSDGVSLFLLHTSQGQGEALLAPAFGEQPAVLQRAFWAFGVLKLLRSRGFYSLHAAGLVSRQGVGLLVVGPSGCGKSTLTLGLLRQGWRCLSDDALLLRRLPDGVEALALRRPCYVHAEATAVYAMLPLGQEVTDTAGGRKRRVDIETSFPGQAKSRCRPQVVLFPRIVPHPSSALVPVGPRQALGHLLAQSGPQLFDTMTMPRHLEVLKQLVHQASCYELAAGRDLHDDPLTVVRLLAEVEGAERWPVSSSN